MIKIISVTFLYLCTELISQQVMSSTNTMNDRIINPQDIVNHINNDPQSSWKADTYGMDEFNSDQFARSHLGVRFDMRNKLAPGESEEKQIPFNQPELKSRCGGHSCFSSTDIKK